MISEANLREYVEYVTDSGDPYAPGHPLEGSDQEVWVSWRIDGEGSTHLEIRVTGEWRGYFVDGKRVEPSWEGGVNVPDVSKWQAVRAL